jgi:hypothetical protein
MSNPKRIGLKERQRRTPAARELSQRSSPYNLQVGAAELGGVIQKSFVRPNMSAMSRLFAWS